MTTHLVTFSDESMSRARELCVLSARHHGVDIVHEYEPSGVASAFIGHETIWNNPKGCGLWAWKPAIILAVMNNLGRVDTAFNLHSDNYIVYADAGVEFTNNVSHIISRMDQDIFLFGNNWEHTHWCKRDVISHIWPMSVEEWRDRWWSKSDEQRQAEDPDLVHWERYSKQVQASVIFFRVSDYTRRFVKEWLDWCLFEGGRLIDDSPSRLPNHPEFREHRHDQAILTTMAYREGVRLHYWPAVYNLGHPLPQGGFVYEKLACYADDSYPSPLFHHHRRRNHEWA